MLRLSDYDVIGMDIDHTIARFKLKELVQTAYRSIAEFLVDKKKYDPALVEDILEYKDFWVKGLIADTERGNILKLSEDGTIVRASHGTRFLDKDEIAKIYGGDMKYEHFDEIERTLKGTNGKYWLYDTYFDSPALAVTARVVDSIDKKNQGPLEAYNFMEDMKDAFKSSYDTKAFGENSGGFFPHLIKTPQKYIHRCSEDVKDWLKLLQERGKKTFLLTNSHADFATMVLENSIGVDWEDYFDLYLTNAGKPSFFSEIRPFLHLDGYHETGEASHLELKGHYSQGNIQDLIKFWASVTRKENPKILFIGDSIRSDCFPAKAQGIDTVLIIEEMEAEGCVPSDSNNQQLIKKNKDEQLQSTDLKDIQEVILSSPEKWGSFFYHDSPTEKAPNTLWSKIITTHCNIAVPNVEFLAGFPLDHHFKQFGSCQGVDGFHPGKPHSLME